MRSTISLGLWILGGLMAHAQDPAVKRIHQLYDSTRPADKDLGIYRLDWAMPFETARKKAMDDKKPLVVVAVRNEHGDSFTGYC